MCEGGVEKSLSDLLCSLDFTRYEVDLLLFANRGIYLQRIPKDVHVIIFEKEHTDGPIFKVLFNNIIHLRLSAIFFRLILYLNKKYKYKLYKFLLPILLKTLTIASFIIF